MTANEVIQDLKHLLPYAIILVVWVLVMLWIKHDAKR
jgi:hypothetical protein